MKSFARGARLVGAIGPLLLACTHDMLPLEGDSIGQAGDEALAGANAGETAGIEENNGGRGENGGVMSSVEATSGAATDTEGTGATRSGSGGASLGHGGTGADSAGRAASTAGRGGGPGSIGGAGGGSPVAGAPGNPSPPASLREKYATYFPIGAAVGAQSYMTYTPLLQQQFDSITCENEMKFDALEPSENQFTYAVADQIVAFAQQNDMKVRGHTLVWHQQNPSWVFSDGSGGIVSKDVLLRRMTNHITNVVKHFRGAVYAWDVVNEAIMEDGEFRTGNESGTAESSPWYAVIGPDYIAEAFRAAHDADPDAKLFYNDYDHYVPAKQQGIYALLKGLLEQGVPVNGVGIQSHLNIEPSADPNDPSYYQDVDHLEAAIELYSSLGLDVEVTQMDMSVYVSGMTYASDQFYTQATFTDALQTEQANRYASFFELFRKYRSIIGGVTFWGVADDDTWLSEVVSGREDFPLLFDTNHEPKPAYDAVMNF